MKFQRVTGLPNLPNLPRFSFNGKRHYQLPDRSIVPSVTTLLGHFEEKGIRRWRAKVGYEEADRISEEARLRGEAFHFIIEDYLENKSVNKNHKEFTRIPILLQNFVAIKPYLRRINNIHYQETCLYSNKMRVAGRCDVIAEFDGILSVIDFKTSRKPKEEKYIQNYFEQTTCYSLMYEELIGTEIPQVVILIAADQEDGTSTLQPFIRHVRDYKSSLLNKINAYYTGMEL